MENFCKTFFSKHGCCSFQSISHQNCVLLMAEIDVLRCKNFYVEQCVFFFSSLKFDQFLSKIHILGCIDFKQILNVFEVSVVNFEHIFPCFVNLVGSKSVLFYGNHILALLYFKLSVMFFCS